MFMFMFMFIFIIPIMFLGDRGAGVVIGWRSCRHIFFFARFSLFLLFFLRFLLSESIPVVEQERKKKKRKERKEKKPRKTIRKKRGKESGLKKKRKVHDEVGSRLARDRPLTVRGSKGYRSEMIIY